MLTNVRRAAQNLLSPTRRVRGWGKVYYCLRLDDHWLQTAMRFSTSRSLTWTDPRRVPWPENGRNDSRGTCCRNVRTPTLVGVERYTGTRLRVFVELNNRDGCVHTRGGRCRLRYVLRPALAQRRIRIGTVRPSLPDPTWTRWLRSLCPTTRPSSWHCRRARNPRPPCSGPFGTRCWRSSRCSRRFSCANRPPIVNANRDTQQYGGGGAVCKAVRYSPWVRVLIFLGRETLSDRNGIVFPIVFVSTSSLISLKKPYNRWLLFLFFCDRTGPAGSRAPSLWTQKCSVFQTVVDFGLELTVV